MRALLFLALLGAAVAIPFTADVLAATAQHQKLYAIAAAAAAAAPDDPVGGHHHAGHTHVPHGVQQHHGGATSWRGPLASSQPAGVGGVLTPVGDTPEVAAAKAQFLNSFNSVLTSGGQPRWKGPVAATVPAGLPGSLPQVQDTAEVAAARAQFFQNYNRAG